MHTGLLYFCKRYFFHHSYSTFVVLPTWVQEGRSWRTWRLVTLLHISVKLLTTHPCQMIKRLSRPVYQCKKLNSFFIYFLVTITPASYNFRFKSRNLINRCWVRYMGHEGYSVCVMLVNDLNRIKIHKSKIDKWYKYKRRHITKYSNLFFCKFLK